MTTDAELSERRARLLGPVFGLNGEDLKREVRDAYSKLASTMDLLSPEQAVWKPDDEEWSAAQVCDHMALSTGRLGNITGLLAKGQAPGDADWDPAPQFKGDASDVGDVRRRLGELSSYANKLYDEAAVTDRTDVTANNSFLGDMNWREWYYFLRVHTLSHVEQIEKLRALDGFPQ